MWCIWYVDKPISLDTLLFPKSIVYIRVYSVVHFCSPFSSWGTSFSVPCWWQILSFRLYETVFISLLSMRDVFALCRFYFTGVFFLSSTLKAWFWSFKLNLHCFWQGVCVILIFVLLCIVSSPAPSLSSFKTFFLNYWISAVWLLMICLGVVSLCLTCFCSLSFLNVCVQFSSNLEILWPVFPQIVCLAILLGRQFHHF